MSSPRSENDGEVGVVTYDGRIVEGPPDVVGLQVEQLPQIVQALEDLSRARKVHYKMLSVLYARGWVSAKGKLRPKGRLFLERWKGVRFVTRNYLRNEGA